MRFSLEEAAKYATAGGLVGLVWAITRLIAVVRKQNANNRQQHDNHIDAVVKRQQTWIDEQDLVIQTLKTDVADCTERYTQLGEDFRRHRDKNDRDALESNRKIADLTRESGERLAEINWMKNMLAMVQQPGPLP